MPSLLILVSAVLILSCGQTDMHRERITDSAKCFAPVTVIGVSNRLADKLLGPWCETRGLSGVLCNTKVTRIHTRDCSWLTNHR